MITLPRKEWMDVLRYVYKKKHDFLFVNLQDEDTKQLHKNFTRLIVSSPNITEFSLDEE